MTSWHSFSASDNSLIWLAYACFLHKSRCDCLHGLHASSGDTDAALWPAKSRSVGDEVCMIPGRSFLKYSHVAPTCQSRSLSSILSHTSRSFLLDILSHPNIPSYSPTYYPTIWNVLQLQPTMHLPTLLVAASSLPLLLATTLPVNELGQPAPSFLQSRTHYKSYCPPRHANAKHQKDIFFEFINVLYSEKNATKAFDTYVAVDLIEHDPFDAQGRDANAAKLSGIIPFANFEVLRQNFDSNIGLIHVRVNEDPEPIALADIYRMNGTCIVEHWDVTQARPANATNPIAMFWRGGSGVTYRPSTAFALYQDVLSINCTMWRNGLHNWLYYYIENKAKIEAMELANAGIEYYINHNPMPHLPVSPRDSVLSLSFTFPCPSSSPLSLSLTSYISILNAA